MHTTKAMQTATMALYKTCSEVTTFRNMFVFLTFDFQPFVEKLHFDK